MHNWAFGVLGELAITRDGTPVVLRGGKLRILLAALLLRAGKPVSEVELIDQIWDEPPVRAQSTLQVYVVRLRQTLGPDGPVISRSSCGYRIEVEPDQVDLHRFHSLAVNEDTDPRAELGRLREALTLWRGHALADVDSEALRPDAARLDDERLFALERRIEIEIDLGGHRELVPELRALVARHPTREKFHALLMLALHRCSRSAEALEVYRDAYRLFSHELGVEPGHGLVLLHNRILRGDPALTRGRDESGQGAIRQLPYRIASFCGRDAELVKLDELAVDNDVTPVVALVGAPGVGKTALAVEWAHRVGHRFPDGHLFAELGGADPAEVIARFVRSLGGRPGPMPVDELSSAYRSLICGRSMLVVLDDVESVDQVRPLLPGTPSCLVLVTSRNSLRGLAAVDDAQVCKLGGVAGEGAQLLLRRVLGERVLEEPDAAAELAELCGGLPLALRVAAVDIASREHPKIADYVRELRAAGPLARLSLDDDQRSTMRAAPDLSYERLPREVRSFFRALGKLSRAGFSDEGAATSSGVPLDEAVLHLERLVAVHMVYRSRAGGYAIHDLLREYAALVSGAGPTG